MKLTNPKFVAFLTTVATITPVVALAATLPVDCSGLITFISTTLAKTLAAFIGAIAVIMMLVAAFQFLTAGGDAEKVKTARGTITWAIIGMVVALISFNIPTILGSFLGGSLPTACL